MFKLIVFLCAGIYAVMFVMGRDGGPVRDGLAGKITPLMQPSEAAAPAATKVAAAAPAPEPAVVATPAADAPVAEAPVAEAAVTPASFPQADADAPETGLTLALPLVDDGAAPPEPQAAAEPAAAEIEAEPVVLYVTASSVNVRSGPSAETEALTRLPRGEAVLVLPSDTPGWSMIRLEGDGVEGYIASRFLGTATGDALSPAAD